MLSDEKCWENSGFFHILYQYSIPTSYIKNFNETGKMTQWIGSYLPLSLMAWDQFLEPRWWREDLSCPLISMWVKSREYLSWAPWSTPHSSLLSSIFHFPPQARGPKLSTEWSRLPTVSLVYKTQRNFPAKNCSFIPGCDTLTPFRKLNTRLGCQGIHFWPLVSLGGGTCFLPNPYKFS